MRRAALIAAVAVLAGFTVLAASAQGARKPAAVRTAERAVKRAVSVNGYASRAVSCHRRGRRGRAARALDCRWRAEKPQTRQRVRSCRGRASVRLVGRRTRVRIFGRRCGSRRVNSLLFFGYSDGSVLERLGPDYAAQLALKGGANAHRFGVDWRFTEPTPGHFDFSRYDADYRAMKARGIRPLMILAYAPSWAWAPGTQCRQGCQLPPDRAHNADWRDFARRVAERYPYAAGIEIWNEPNLVFFWKPYPDPARYVELLKLAYQGIKAARPDMPVIAGGFGELQTNGADGISLETFLRAVYAHGAKGHFDAIGFHPYPDGPGDTILDRAFAQVRRVRHEYGDDDTPLWATETGLTTTGRIDVVTENQQASELVRIYRKLKAMPDVEAIFVHTLLEPDPALLAGGLQGFGVLRYATAAPKPAYCALGLERTGRWPC